ncbi:MAG: Cupin 2 conserved barrel domain protein [Gemmatimonadetes bacterium]|nr:Cupin 2 conserved barrel domain protein [Gemmatimonadota bacterium]
MSATELLTASGAPAAEPQTVDIRTFRTTVRVPAASTGGALSVLEHTLPAGYVAMPVHTHARETEVTHVLEGTLTVQVGDGVTRAGPGDLVVKPAGVRHAFWNEGLRPVRFLEIVTPGGIEEFYAEVARAIGAKGKPDMGKVMAAAERHGLRFEMGSLMDLLDRYGVRLS